MRQRAGVAAILLVVAVMAASAIQPPADPAALVVQLSGRVEVQRAGRTLPVTVGASLEAGDRLVVPAGGRAVLMYRTGKMETATSTLTIEARQSEQPSNLYRQTVQTAVAVATTDAGKQPNRQGMIRPVPGEPTPSTPRNGIKVLDVRPTFTWLAVPGATAYTIQIRRTDLDGARPVRFQHAHADTTWTYPADSPALVPGASYEWTVAAAPGGRPAVAARFRVVSAVEFDALSRMLGEFAAAGIDPMSDGLFVTALWYRETGLFYEAQRALDQMSRAGAGSGRMFHLLRGVVLDQLGDIDAASLAFQAADREPAS
ncbi:MAG TPA: hypothetical protein VMN60_04680 [Longimicrobiales bacterium]|nr:hypothetical protein [Longimicrobiales bacterium]